MTDVSNRTGYSGGDIGLLLPAESLALLGAGREGALAIQEYGWPSGDFDHEFEALVQRLEASGDLEARPALAAAQNIARIARASHGWLSITSTARAVAPTIVLLGDGMVLAARLHGEAVEYVAGSEAVVARAVRAILDTQSEALVTGFSGGVARCGVRVYEGVADVSAHDDGCLGRLTVAASRGLDELVGQLAREATTGTLEGKRR